MTFGVVASAVLLLSELFCSTHTYSMLGISHHLASWLMLRIKSLLPPPPPPVLLLRRPTYCDVVPAVVVGDHDRQEAGIHVAGVGFGGARPRTYAQTLESEGI